VELGRGAFAPQPNTAKLCAIANSLILTQPPYSDNLMSSFGPPIGLLTGLQEVVMRYFGLLLVTLLTIGCGTAASSGNHDPLVMTAFSPPSIMTLTPESVPVNSVPFMMTINGGNFTTDAVVFWQGTPQSTTFITSNQLVVKVTDTDLMFTGLVPIYVRTGGQNSNTVDFDVTAQ
jgi:hypothetical protein